MLYEYICEQCQIIKEVEHSMSESPEIRCDECDSIIKRQITGGSGVIYKGVGWASKGTATAPKPKRVTEHGVTLPSYMDGMVDPKLVKGKHT